jgi:hypothetical protein
MNATGMRSAAAVHLADARASMVSPMASAMPAPEMAPAKVSATQVMMVDRPQADPNANRSVIGPTVIAARVIGTIPTAIGRVGDGHHARRRNVRRAGAAAWNQWVRPPPRQACCRARGNMHIVAGRQWSRTRPTMRPERRSIPPALRPEKTSRSPVAGFGPTLCARNATSMTGACQGDDDRSHSPSMRLFSLS